MRLLLDSNIVVPLMRRERERLGAAVNLLIASHSNDLFVSVASLWEIAIKTRLGKLHPSIPIAELPRYCASLGLLILHLNELHAVGELVDPPDTNDPFDRMLLAQCQVEDMKLITTDRALQHHRLAWRPA